jgi:capsule biosynthesis phosphatase
MSPPTDKRVVFDIDGVLCKKDEDLDYADRVPHPGMVERLQDYYEEGYYIILYTARNMNTHQGRIGKINADTAKTLLQWLDEHNIPHDEIYYGKPWCGHDGFYVDDKAIRPSELANHTTSEIQDILDKEFEFVHS